MSLPSGQPAFGIDLLRGAGPADFVGLAPMLGGLSEALRCEFVVFPTIPEPVNLEPPVDWTQDPFNSRSWRAQLHALRFLRVLLTASHSSANEDALRTATVIVLDWVTQNAHGSRGISEYAWADKLVGDRAPTIGYLLRATSHRGLLSTVQEESLLAAAIEHAEFLASDEHYISSTNHGLFQDAGLLFLSYYLGFLPEAASWRDRGVERFLSSASRFVAEDEGVYLEHSPAYQWVIVSLIDRIATLNDADERILSLGRTLRDASGWLVLPDGCTPPLGDSDLLPAPKWASRQAGAREGLKHFRRAGWAVARTRESMLMVSAGYHSHAHKHADELGFCLFEAGRLILGEAGKYGYDSEDAARRYALSSAAHNVLLVDNENFTWRDTQPYGGAITATGRTDDWYAIEGRNPLLELQGVSHRRLFVYRPAQCLVIIDRIQSLRPRTYTRLFHFGSDIDVYRDDSSVGFQADDLTGVLLDVSSVKSTMEIAKGEREPVLTGWMFPRYREWIPIPTVSLESAAATQASLATVFMFDDLSTSVAISQQSSGVSTLSFSGTTQGELTIVTGGVGELDLAFQTR